jgi:hypothetical protein
VTWLESQVFGNVCIAQKYFFGGNPAAFYTRHLLFLRRGRRSDFRVG